jgi:membrane protein implicated in regulation of membrane protease activity
LIYNPFFVTLPFETNLSFRMNKLAFILEQIWLALSLFCLGLGVWATVKVGFSTSYVFFVLAVVALLMYFLRRNRRKRLENQQ